MTILILEGLCLLYLAWIIFIAVRASTLKEIKQKTFDYTLFTLFTFLETNTVDGAISSCRYVTRVGLILPIFLISGIALIIICTLIWFLIGIPLRILTHWMLYPLFCGKVPAEAVTGNAKEYFKKLINPRTSPLNQERDGWETINMIRVIKLHPIFWIAALGAVFQIYRVISNMASNKATFTSIESLLTFGIGGIVLCIVLCAWLEIPNKMSDAWKTLKEKTCRKIRIVE